jgi:soluble lytic murein transglycosylase
MRNRNLKRGQCLAWAIAGFAVFGAPIKSIAASALQSVSLSLADPISNSPVSAHSPAVKDLIELKSALEAKKYDLCLATVSKAVARAKSLEPWILVYELECAEKGLPSKAHADRLNGILKKFEGKKNWLSWGPWSPRLRTAWLRATVQALELDQKFARERAWGHVETLSAAWNLTPGGKLGLDDATRARVWKIAGELLFLSQKTEGAREFFRRSLGEQEQADVRDRLNALESKIELANSSADGRTANSALNSENKISADSSEENELFNRVNQSLKAGDLLAAVEDSVKLINEFPGSSRTKWASDRIFESYISVAEKSHEKFLPVKSAILQAMEKSEADRVAEWARLAFNRGLWADSARLGKLAAEKQAPSRSTRTIELAMDAAIAIDDSKTAKLMAERLIEKHVGSSSARLAQFRMGLMAYREKEWARASGYFEKMIATQSSDNFELQARYWLWRSLQKQESPRAKGEAEEIAKRFPFSYYGLRARLESAGGKIEWSQVNPVLIPANKIENKLWMTQEEKLSFERATVLVTAGWFDEAQAELRTLPEPVTPEEKAIRARIWAAAKNYLLAARLANEAWDVKFELRRPELMEAAWPKEFKDLFETAARQRNLSSLLTRSLTKQESGYSVRAVSPSNALGLMQMIPPTAREIADDLKLGKITLPDDLFDPSRNIQMGTHYVAKMLSQFKGHVPFALAAYNAGPTRIERWLKARSSLIGIEATRSSDPELEIWIDEFPFSETSFYVKAILRNILLYQIVEEGVLIAQEPLWKGAAAAARPTSGR